MIKFDFNKATYLLGAGASCDAGLPSATRIEEELIKEMDSVKHWNNHYDFTKKLYYWVRNKIEDYQNVNKQYCGSYGGIDIEDIISAIDAISTLSKQAITPFLKDNHNEIFEFIANNHEYDRKFYDRYKTADDKINFIEGRALEVSDELKKVLISILKVDDVKKLEYLKPLLDKGLKENLNIFTLNYDDTIETLVDHNDAYKVIYKDGFEYDSALKRKIYKGNWCAFAPAINLYKLHGSIDWVYDHGISDVAKVRDRDFIIDQHLHISLW